LSDVQNHYQVKLYKILQIPAESEIQRKNLEKMKVIEDWRAIDVEDALKTLHTERRHYSCQLQVPDYKMY